MGIKNLKKLEDKLCSLVWMSKINNDKIKYKKNIFPLIKKLNSYQKILLLFNFSIKLIVIF